MTRKAELLRKMPQFKDKTVTELNDAAHEEVIADAMETILSDGTVMEDLATYDKSLWEKIKDFIVDLIKKIKKAYGELSPNSQAAKVLKDTVDDMSEIQRLWAEGVREAGERTRKAKVETENTGESGIKYSLAPNAKAEVKKALKDKNYRDEILLTDNTPRILLGAKGIRDLPMTMNASHIRENIFTEDEAKGNGFRVGEGINYHGLGETLFFKVIEDLENATEVYRGTKKAEKSERRENYFLLISQHKDKDGNVINIPVYINEKSRYNRVFIDSNKIATVFGRDNLRDYLNKEVTKGNLVRVKIQKGSTQASEGTSPIEADYSEDTSKDSIAQPTKKVNRKFSISENSSDTAEPFKADEARMEAEAAARAEAKTKAETETEGDEIPDVYKIEDETPLEAAARRMREREAEERGDVWTLKDEDRRRQAIRDHELLADALMETAQSESEYRTVKKYKEKVEEIADAESRITELRKKTAELNREMDSLREKIKGVDKSRREEIKQAIYDH